MALPVQVCPSCKQSNNCTADDVCWCHQLPAILPATVAQCYCSSCLLSVVITEADRLLATHKYKQIADLGPTNQPIQGLDFTINEDGNLVFTEWYHRRRGYCCGSGCSQCPYEHINVAP